MKLRLFFLGIFILSLCSSAFCQHKHSDDPNKRKLGKHGCIPSNKIYLLTTKEFIEFESSGKFFIEFLGGTIHKLDDNGNLIDEVIKNGSIYFRSDKGVAKAWNIEIQKHKDLTKLGIGIESELVEAFLGIGRDYFEKASIWIDDKNCIFNCPKPVKSD